MQNNNARKSAQAVVTRTCTWKGRCRDNNNESSTFCSEMCLDVLCRCAYTCTASSYWKADTSGTADSIRTLHLESGAMSQDSVRDDGKLVAETTWQMPAARHGMA